MFEWMEAPISRYLSMTLPRNYSVIEPFVGADGIRFDEQANKSTRRSGC